jgi:hypothetical protein
MGKCDLQSEAFVFSSRQNPKIVPMHGTGHREVLGATRFLKEIPLLPMFNPRQSLAILVSRGSVEQEKCDGYLTLID